VKVNESYRISCERDIGCIGNPAASVWEKFRKKTRMKSKTSHPSNENFALRIQFPVELSIVDKTQNFHDKGKGIRQSTHPSPAKKMIYSEPVQGPDS